MQLQVFKASVLNQYLYTCIDEFCRIHYVLHPLHATFMSQKFQYTLSTNSLRFACAIPEIPPTQFSPRGPRVPTKEATRHLLLNVCTWSASILAYSIHKGHARAQCSKERNDQSQNPQNDANGTNDLRGWQLIRNHNTLPLKYLSSFQVQKFSRAIIKER